MKERKSRRTVQIGFGNSVLIDRIIGVFSVDTNPIKKMITENKNIGFVIDLTKDKKTKSAILMDNDYIILSPINHSTLVNRINRDDTIMSKNALYDTDED